MTRRAQVLSWLFWLIVLSVITFRCGRSKKSDDSAAAVNKAIPASWDGQTDWADSQWEVHDE